jgi:hypothetical protein
MFRAGILGPMSEVTRILSAIEQGDPQAAEELLPLVYDELRKLAAQKLAREKPGQTLEATALVHEAYLRLVDVDKMQNWDCRGHFFAAAAEAMRRILIESARRKRILPRVNLDSETAARPEDERWFLLADAPKLTPPPRRSLNCACWRASPWKKRADNCVCPGPRLTGIGSSPALGWPIT